MHLTNDVLPVAFEPTNIFNFLYLKDGTNSKFSFSIMLVLSLFGNEKLTLKS